VERRFFEVFKMSKTIGLEPVRDFVKYTLYSGFVKNVSRPVSGLVVAEPERGKSTEARKWRGLGVMTLQDLTWYGLNRAIIDMSPNDREIFHHLVIPDLEKIGSRNRAVRDELLSGLRIVMDEGVQDISTGRMKIHLDKPIVLGILMCTTPEDIGDRRSVFRTLSFQSRLIPFTYDFGRNLKVKVLEFIESEEHTVKEQFFFKREEKVEVTLPPHFSKHLKIYSVYLAKQLERFSRKSPIKETNERDRLLGIRAKENLMAFLKSIALYHGSTTVQQEHFDEFARLYEYMNYKFNEIGEV